MPISLSDKKKLALVLLTSFIVQIPSIVLGFELCDSGFYLTFYDNIFSHPDAVRYNFMYYTSGLLGWLLLRLTGGSLIGIRIAGALVNVGVAWMAWSMLRGRGRLLPMLCAVTLIGVCSWECTLTFNYDLATMLLASVSLMLMTKAMLADTNPALSKKVKLLYFLSGLICGINAFSRLPNVIDIVFVLIIPLSCMGRLTAKECMTRMAVWIGSWCAGVGVILVFAVAAGHWDALTSSLISMLQAGSSGRDESIHSMRHLISANVHTWIPILLRAAGFGLTYYLFARCVSGTSMSRRTSTIIAAIVLISVTCGALVSCRGIWFDKVRVWLFAIAVGGGVLSYLIKDDCCRSLRLTALCGLFMVVLLPAGSDGVVFGPGPLVLGFLLPASFCAIASYGRRWIGRCTVLSVTLLLVYAYCLKLKDGISYFDSWPVAEMDSAIDVPRAEGLRTTQENARFYEEVFTELGRHVHPGDTMMVYGSGPLVNYLTGTLPAFGCSWPAQLTPSQLRGNLDGSELPEYVMMLKFRTLIRLNRCSPEQFVRGRTYDDNCHEIEADVYHTPEKSGIVFDFVTNNHYTLLTDNPSFLLYKR